MQPVRPSKVVVTLDDVAAKVLSSLSDLEKQVEVLKARISFLEQRVELLTNRVDNIEKKQLEELRQQIIGLGDDIDYVARRIHEELGPR